MRVTVLAIGSRGDVQPYVALALGLRSAGHDVTVGTHATFAEMVLARDLRFTPIEGDPRRILETEEGRAWLESGSNPVRFVLRFLRLARPLAAAFLHDSIAACRESDAIVYSPLGFAGYHVAEARGVPSYLAALQPMTRTRSFPAVGVRPWRRLGGPYNLLTHLVAEQVSWQPFRRLVNEWRRDALGLPSMPFFGPYGLAGRMRYPILYGFSPSFIPKPADWGPWLDVTGYWFLDAAPGWRPPAALADFIARGDPPVYVGFGSMTVRDPPAVTGVVLEALRRTGRRAVLSKGWAGLTGGKLPDWAFPVEDVPHDWLFPRMAAVVHHGGAGTTAAGLRAGTPTVAVPFFGDQYFWADRVRAVGVGPRPVPRRDLSIDRLTAVVEAALYDDRIRARASELGRRIRGEDGVGRAVDAFQRSVTSPRALR